VGKRKTLGRKDIEETKGSKTGNGELSNAVQGVIEASVSPSAIRAKPKSETA